MNISISLEDQVGERARDRAAEMGKTLEDEVEEFIRGLAGKSMGPGWSPNGRPSGKGFTVWGKGPFSR